MHVINTGLKRSGEINEVPLCTKYFDNSKDGIYVRTGLKLFRIWEVFFFVSTNKHNFSQGLLKYTNFVDDFGVELSWFCYIVHVTFKLLSLQGDLLKPFKKLLRALDEGIKSYGLSILLIIVRLLTVTTFNGGIGYKVFRVMTV